MTEIFTVDQGIDFIAQKAIELYEKNRKMVTVLVAGGSASGKSTGTGNLEIRLNNLGYRVLVISADDYYKGGRIIMELMKSQGIGFDDPGAVDSGWLRRDIISLTNGQQIMEKKYKFGPDPGKETGKILDPPQILIIEGLFVLREDLRDLANIKVFFDIGLHGWLLRRIFRDTKRTGQRPADILHYCATVVEPKYREWVLSTKKFADFVIRNEYDPGLEAKNTNRSEFQIKLRTDADLDELSNKIMSIGADRLGTLWQKDTYFNPEDRDLRLTGESMRIREEPGGYIWTYKGPKVVGDATIGGLNERPKYEFPIKSETRDVFMEIYGNEIKIIAKTRTLFHLGHIVISIDSVRKIADGKEENLGNFVEIRATSKGSEKRVEKIRSRIGLESAKVEERSYVEI